MTNWVIGLHPNHYLRLRNMQWNPWEMVPVSFSGPVNKDQTEDGSVSMPKSLLQKERNTLTKHTSGRNTITIRTMLDHRRSREINSNITTPSISTVETVSGSSKTTDSTSSPPWTSPTLSVKSRTRRRSS